MNILLDADSIIWAVGSACDNRHYLVQGKRYDTKAEANIASKKSGAEIVPAKDPESEEDTLATLLSYTEEKVAMGGDTPTSVKLFIGSQGNFRNKVAIRSTYKGSRIGGERPTHEAFIKEKLQEYYDVHVAHPALEADDEISIVAKELWAKAEWEDHLILSIDKDLLQIPGNHKNFNTGMESLTSGFQGIKLLACQMLTGDSGDDICGLSGVGPKSKKLDNIKKAENVNEVFHYVMLQYHAHFGYYAFQFMREAFMLLRLVGTPTKYERVFMDYLNIQEDYWR